MCVCGIDDNDYDVAVVTICCIFFEGHVSLCLCLLPYTQNTTLNKDKTLLVPPQMEHLVYGLDCEMDD